MSVEPFKRLVKLAARAFYDDITMKGDNQQKNGRSDNRGMAVVVLDALTSRQWVREEDFAKEIKLHTKQLRKILRFFEEEKLVTRDHRKESAKGSKVFVAASAAAHGEEKKEGEEKVKMHTHSYCCLDYAQIFDVVRYRMHKMKKKLKDELDSRNTVQMYICPNCSRKYSAFDALNLISFTDEYFHCENCNGELVEESDKLAAEEMGDGDDNARKRRREKLKGILEKIEVQLKPLVVQLNRVKELPVPHFGTLQAWEASAAFAGLTTGKDSDDPNKSSQFSGYSTTPVPFLGETKVEVEISGVDEKQGTASETKPATQKVLPPWMIKEGMNLTKEQRGESSSSTRHSIDISDDKKHQESKDSKEDEEKRLQEEYVKQYYEAMARAQEEAAGKEKLKEDLFGGSPESEERKTGGVKRQREEDDEDEYEWEDGDVNINGESNEGSSSVKLTADLNMEAKEESEEDDADDVEWEDG